jgi:serine phosphatase RsbU (regulator of sigma subunit)
MTPGAPEVRQMKGVPLAAKMAASLAILVAVFMASFGVVLKRFVEETVTVQILRAATDSARSAAQADMDAWTPNFDTEDQGLSRDEMQAKVDAMSPYDYRLYEGDQTRKAQITWNRQRFARFLGAGTRILAVELFRWGHGERGALVGASYLDEENRAAAEFVPLVGRPAERFGAGAGQEGLLRVGNDTQHVIRGSYPIMDRNGMQEGEIAIHIDAKAIEEAVASFYWKVGYAGMVFILVGAAVSLLLGRRITRPLRLLQDDIRAVAAGDLDHHTRPHSTDEIGQLARTFDHMTRSLAEARDSERAAAASRRELAVAAEVTGSLFPKRLPDLPGWSMGGLHDTSGAPGGGTYAVLKLPGGKVGFLLAEASGGGVPGALVAAMARSSLRVVAEREADPGVVLREVNAHLSPDLREGLYVTALLAVLDPATGKLAVANAGHPPLLHHHVEIDGLETVLSEGIALGFDKGPVFDQTLKVAEIEVEPGDTVVLYAAGVCSLSGADGHVLGENRFAALVKREAGQPADQMVQRIGATMRKFRGRENLGPEVTLLAIGRQA